MFKRRSLVNLSENKDQFLAVQKDASNPHSPHYFKASLQFGLCQMYGIGVTKELIVGFDKIIDVVFANTRYSSEASEALDPCVLEGDLNSIFQHYNMLQEKSPRTNTILALCYGRGIGVAANPQEAFRLFRLAADQGQAIWFHGLGADQGDAIARYMLGYCDEQGIMVSTDREKTIRLFRLAALPQSSAQALQRVQQTASSLPVPQTSPVTSRSETARLEQQIAEANKKLQKQDAILKKANNEIRTLRNNLKKLESLVAAAVPQSSYASTSSVNSSSSATSVSSNCCSSVSTAALSSNERQSAPMLSQVTIAQAVAPGLLALVPFDLINTQTARSPSEIWSEYRKDIPVTTKEWEAYFVAITKGINKKKGSNNCAHCALRTNEYLSSGFIPGQPAVPKGDAKLETKPIFKKTGENSNNKSEQKEKEELIRSFCEDKRLTDQCPEYFNDGSVEDISTDMTVIDLEPGPLSKESIKRIRFLKADKDDLIEKLQQSPRRAKDGSAYGFIILTFLQNQKIGHFINYFITPNKDVFFLDAQQKNPASRVTTDMKFLEGYRPEIFFINAQPPEGFKIKEEPTRNNFKDTAVLVKAEIQTDSPVNIQFSEKFNKVLKLAVLKDEKVLSELLANSSVDFFDQGCIPIMLLAKNNEISACNFLIEKFGAKKKYMLNGLCWGNNNPLPLIDNDSNFNRLASYAARGGHRNLAWTLFTDPRNKAPYYCTVAEGAAFGGHKDLVWEFLTDPHYTYPNYNGVAAIAAKHGHQELVLSLLRAPCNEAPDYNDIAVVAAQHGHKSLILVLLWDLRNTDPDYNRIATVAALAGYRDLSVEIYKLKLQRTELQMQLAPYMMSAASQFLSRKRIGENLNKPLFESKEKEEQSRMLSQQQAMSGLPTVAQPPLTPSSNPISDTVVNKENVNEFSKIKLKKQKVG
jgi:hypothetical protein